MVKQRPDKVEGSSSYDSPKSILVPQEKTKINILESFLDCRNRDKGPDGAERGTVSFFRSNRAIENFAPRKPSISPFLGPFWPKPGRVLRCINRSVLQFLEPGHISFERVECREQNDTLPMKNGGGDFEIQLRKNQARQQIKLGCFFGGGGWGVGCFGPPYNSRYVNGFVLTY